MQQKWWKESVAYQIYPRSFQDSNGDGIGDLPGVLSRLDYLQSLGVNVVWLCPMYKSPQDDNGYDISDYQDIHFEFGTMEDFDLLLKEMHRRGMKLIIDLVINHTSDEHPWFIESRSSRESEKRDWYIWRDGKNGREPNNWESIFGGSAWKLDQATKQYFLHLFSTRQPDLNWDNLEMRGAIYRMIRWWLDKGVDGFRIDAISHMKKEPGYPDLPNPSGLDYVPSFPMHMNVKGVLDYLREICRETFSKYDVMTVGEANGVDSKGALEWVGEGAEKLNMLFQFEHLSLWNTDPSRRIELAKVKEVLTRWQMSGVWNALYLENHDIPRVVSKWGNSTEYWRESATALGAMYFLMRGTPFIYQGQELGMTNTVFSGLDDFNDVSAKNFIRARKKDGWSDEKILVELGPTSRDNARTPMQWTSAPNAGFTTGEPWLKLNPNYLRINAEDQETRADSPLNFYRALSRLRAAHPALVHGAYELLMPNHPQVFAYRRQLENVKISVVCNLSPTEAMAEVHGKLLLGNYSDSASKLRPYEARVLLEN